jgi:hypothetical protein
LVEEPSDEAEDGGLTDLESAQGRSGRGGTATGATEGEDGDGSGCIPAATADSAAASSAGSSVSLSTTRDGGGGTSNVTAAATAVRVVHARVPRTRRQQLHLMLTCAAICCGFGLSMFLNGIAGRIIPPRRNEYTDSTDTPLGLRLLASLPDPIYVLCR